MPRRKHKPKTNRYGCKSADFCNDNGFRSDSGDGHDDNDDDVTVLSTDERELPQRNAANARERARMRVLSKAFCRLKTTLPWVPADTKLSKLDTLRLATSYIAHLRAILTNVPDHFSSHLPLREDDIENDNKKSSIHFKNLTWPFAVSQHQLPQPQPQPFQQQPQTQPERHNLDFNIEPELPSNVSYHSNINTCCIVPNQTASHYLANEVADQNEHQNQTIQSMEQYFY